MNVINKSRKRLKSQENKEKMNKTKISKIGRRGKMGLTILVALMFIGIASAALLPHYNKVTTKVQVSQSVLLDGNDYTNPLTREFNATGGDCKSSCHWLNNTGNENAPIVFNTTYYPDGEGITTKYYTPTYYTFQTTVGTQPVDITVTDGDCHITWTIDFPGEAPYNDPTTEGNGHWAVGLVIATDGDGNGPSFQIHNNDGTDATYPWGTWLYSPWGPTISDGWMGWHSGSINIPLEELSCGWAEATGEKYNEVNPDGIFTITIAKCVLGEDFHWALNLAIGGGFYSDYMTYEQMAYPLATPGPSFNWGTPIVNMTGTVNYEPATIMTDLSAGFTLGKYQSKEIIICHHFDRAIVPGTYYITSLFQPGT